MPNFNGTLDWEDAPKSERDKCRKEYEKHYEHYSKKIRNAEKNKKQPHIVDELWRKLDVPFLSFEKYPNILRQFEGKRTSGKET